jgi:predicted integral membrane protein DUF2269
MRLYGVTMFVHVLGVIALFGGFAMQQRAGARLRAAGRYDEARPWSAVLDLTRPMVPSGAIMLLATGAVLAARLAPGAPPPVWVPVAAVTVLAVGLLGWLVVNRRIAAIAGAVRDGDGALPADARRRIASASLWSALAASNGAALGTLWLMTNKPGVVESALAVLLPAAIGAAVGVRLARA